MIRPELRAAIARHSELIWAVIAALFGGWLISLGGLILQPLGALVGVAGLAWAMIAWRRTRFSREVAGPGLVEIDEGRISYLGAGTILGGEIALRDLSEIRLLCLNDRQHWRLKSFDGQALMIPLDAAGAGRLHDAFATLPGVEMGKFITALDTRMAAQVLWRNPTTERRSTA